MCQWGGRPSTIFGIEEEPTKKNQHVKNFQTTEDKIVAVYSSRDEDALGIAFVHRKTKNIIWDMKKPKFQNNAMQRTLREKKELIF